MLPVPDHALRADPACRPLLGLFGGLQRVTGTAQLSLITPNRSLCRVAEQGKSTRCFLGLSAAMMGWKPTLGCFPCPPAACQELGERPPHAARSLASSSGEPMCAAERFVLVAVPSPCCYF